MTLRPSMATANPLQELTPILQEQLTLLEQSLPVLDEQARAIINNRLNEVELTRRSLRHSAKTLVQLEQKRLGWLQQQGLPVPLKLTELEQHLPLNQTERQTLKTLQEELRRMTTQFFLRQQQVERLLRASVEWIQETVQYVTPISAPAKVEAYSAQGVSVSAPRKPAATNTAVIL
jgi:FlgN protein